MKNNVSQVTIPPERFCQSMNFTKHDYPTGVFPPTLARKGISKMIGGSFDGQKISAPSQAQMIHLEKCCVRTAIVKKTPWTMVLQNQHPQPLFPAQFWWISTTGKIHRQGGQSHRGHEDNIHLVATLLLRFAQAGRTISINISVKIASVIPNSQFLVVGEMQYY